MTIGLGKIQRGRIYLVGDYNKMWPAKFRGFSAIDGTDKRFNDLVSLLEHHQVSNLRELLSFQQQVNNGRTFNALFENIHDHHHWYSFLGMGAKFCLRDRKTRLLVEMYQEKVVA